MYIQCVEIGNFRKLKAARIDFEEEKTVFVGANNSGKTSAMVALRLFLIAQGEFTINDFTLCDWTFINHMGREWEQALEDDRALPDVQMDEVLPFLDVWLQVGNDELHQVQELLPTLDWAGGVLGVRLRLEPKDGEALQRDFLKLRREAKRMLAVPEEEVAPIHLQGADSPKGDHGKPFSLWPRDLIDFLGRRQRFRTLFTVNAYLLDPARLVSPKDGYAQPQELPANSESVEGDPFKGLIRVNEISAQRGFGQASPGAGGPGDDASVEGGDASGGRRLSAQLRKYYAQHLDPSEQPGPEDLEALRTLYAAERAFESRLNLSFEDALKELEDIGYPGVTDPKLTISTRIRATDGLNHGAAVQYEVPTHTGESSSPHRLPEDSNGLGYQNLVSMIFALMSFRDRWMRKGKAGISTDPDDAFVPPLHLVLIEEPEAYLHAQVQQVFINKAYEVLRKHPHLGESKVHRTQLIVSTHSSHLAHECEFASLRYFRRMPAAEKPGAVPLTSVVNLSEVFGGIDPTERFVTRYLRTTHCDLFFADGAVLVEGPAEKMLVPHLVRTKEPYSFLRRCYISWLEIGGSHAHRLKPLLEHLGLTTLVITDLDAKARDSGSAVPPCRGGGQVTRNQSLRTWIPGQESLDVLLDMPQDQLVDPKKFGIRVAYQQPVMVAFQASNPVEVLANTFEDALLYENVDLFSRLTGDGLIRKFQRSLEGFVNPAQLARELHDHLAKGGKAEFALDLLFSNEMDNLAVPAYIHQGLTWLADQLKRKEVEVLETAKVPA